MNILWDRHGPTIREYQIWVCKDISTADQIFTIRYRKNTGKETMTYARCLLAFVKHTIPKVALDLPIFYMNFSPIQISETGEGNKTKHSFNQLFCMGVTHTYFHRVLHKVLVPSRGNSREYSDQYGLTPQRGVTSTARHAARSHSFIYISTT